MKPPEPSPASLPADRTSAGRYLRLLCGAFALIYLLPFLLLQIPSFERWGGSSFGPALDFGFQTAGQNADVLLFGDSSVAVGIDPRQMSAELGLKVLNLPNTGASLHVLGEMNLQHYLATNRPPRLIVFYFVPWNLNYSHEPAGERVYEGEEMLARHANWRQIADHVRAYPLASLQFSFRFYNANPPIALRNVLRHQHPAAEVAAAMGYADPLKRRPPMTAPCTLPALQAHVSAMQTAQELMERYRTSETDVLFYLAPLPACANVGALAGQSYAALGADAPLVLPVEQFKLDFAYAHLLPGSVPAATRTLAGVVRGRLVKATADSLRDDNKKKSRN